MGRLRYLSDRVTLQLDADACTGCGMCVEVCPHGVFELVEGKARIIDRDACMECGACANNCATEAIVVAAGVGCAAALLSGVVGRRQVCGEGAEEGCGS